MNKVFSLIDDKFADPLFEVFDGGDFVLSSYRDIEGDKTEARIFFPGSERIPEAKKALSDALAIIGCPASVDCSVIPDEDWKLSYRRHFKPDRIGARILVLPAWEADSFVPGPGDEGRKRIVLDPGLAFGTGKHETTRTCLEFIDALSADGGSFLDMGCGSGILSIAAEKLGFSDVAGFDIDPDAVAAARENAAANSSAVSLEEFALGGGKVTLDATIEAAKGVYPDLALQSGPAAAESAASGRAIDVFGKRDVVVANILGPLLVAFADEIAPCAGKWLVLSGILDSIYDEVAKAYVDRGFIEMRRKTSGEWTTGLFKAPVSGGRRSANAASSTEKGDAPAPGDGTEAPAQLRRRTWYVLRVKPRTEKKVAKYLDKYGYFRHLPLYTKISKVQRRKVRRELPLFPGYVFTRLLPEERVKMLQTNLIIATIRIDRPRRTIHQLRQITRATKSEKELKRLSSLFTSGDTVRVVSGPLRGTEGRVKYDGKTAKLILNVEILGSSVELSISPDEVEKITK